MVWIWIWIVLFVVVGIALIVFRREAASIQAHSLGANMPAGCAVAEGIFLMLLGLCFYLIRDILLS